MTYALIVLLLIQSVMHYIERQSLIDRIDGRKPDTKGKPPKSIQSAHDRVLQQWKTGGEKR